MKIVSVPGRLVRDPATRRPVDSDGIDIDPTDLVWARLLADGDVAAAPVEAPPAPKGASPRTAPDQEA
ncbi:hypothetical protein J2X47_004081 [Sphingomonas sp. BE270]|jgi:hypothetical protein|uniref:DUF2635 domain-containing protein n=1 Tax=unclassified Sphingomonas TaxID=196159 RepID=UPI00053DAFFE|nr:MULTISPECIES: DUF2635 domain-containing protein [unclassified Sphingomonas]MDR7259875.1 hypothetical protein [Sphingomonas sp. BE270]